ncbi:hypothetical protein LA080_008831 [Diaporthe eres]|nr:hypothetical protein LA080_008831 [Diaporthe eres]
MPESWIHRWLSTGHHQKPMGPLDPFWLEWLPNRLVRSGPAKMHELGDSADANGGKLGWREGASRTRPAQSRAQDANLHDTRFAGPAPFYQESLLLAAVFVRLFLTAGAVQCRRSAGLHYAAEMLICGIQYPSFRGFTVAAPGSFL